VKIITAALTTIFLLADCEWFGPAEKYKTDSGRTTYRSAEENSPDAVTPLPQKVPGQSRR